MWPVRVCAAEQGMVFKVLSLQQGIQFQYLASLTGCLIGLEAFQGRNCSFLGEQGLERAALIQLGSY